MGKRQEKTQRREQQQITVNLQRQAALTRGRGSDMKRAHLVPVTGKVSAGGRPASAPISVPAQGFSPE